MKIELSPVIYLDTSFIVEVYETTTKSQVPVKITKTDDISANVSLGFIGGGASSKETKEFPMSIRMMYEKLRKRLQTFQTIDLKSIEYAQLPECFWINGVLGATGSATMQGDVTIHRESFFQLDSDHTERRRSLVLVTNDVYFTTGYDSVQKHLAVSCQGFAIRVKALIKLLALDRNLPAICAPLVMEKEGNV